MPRQAARLAAASKRPLATGAHHAGCDAHVLSRPIRYHVVNLILPSRHTYFTFNCETCGPVDRAHRDKLFHLLPPLLLPPLTEEQKDREDVHRKLPFPQMFCDPQSPRTLMLPLVVKGHWMLILISPHCSRGLITILSSRRRYGIAEVKQALRATFDSEHTPLHCVDGPSIVSWDIQYPFSVNESPRSCDGEGLRPCPHRRHSFRQPTHHRVRLL